MKLSYYICYLLGLLIQFIPSAAIIIIPYRNAESRIPKKWFYLGSLLLFMLFSALYPFLSWYYRGKSNLAEYVFGNLYTTLLLVLFLIFYFIAIRDYFTKKLLVAFTGVLYAAFQYSIINTPFIINRYLSSSYIYARNDLIAYFVTAFMLTPLWIFFETKIITRYLDVVVISNIKRDFIVLIISSVLYFFMASFYSSITVNDLTFEPLILLATLLMIFLYYFYFSSAIHSAKDAENRLETELLRENSKTLMQEIERSRDIFHDLRHLLIHLSNLPESEITSELRMQIEKVVKLTHNTDFFFCENNCLNTLFQYYSGYANEMNVPINISVVCGQLPIENSDLTLLIGNALENAIISAKEYLDSVSNGVLPQDKEAGNIKVIGKIIEHNLAIQITNPCLFVRYKNPAFENAGGFLPASAFLSVHEDGGRGLFRIDIITKKYSGEASFHYDREKCLFTTRILMPSTHP